MKKNPLTELDAAIEIERRVIEKLQKNCLQARDDARKGEEQQARLAYRALADGDAAAQAALSEAEDLLSKSQSRAKSSEIALQTSHDKLEVLRQEREQVFREQKRIDYARECVELLGTDAEELETALTVMSTVRESIRARLKKMEGIAIEANIDAVRVHSRVREALRHCVELRGQFESTWMSRETKQQFAGPISEVLRGTLKGIIPELDVGEERRSA